MSKHFGSGTQKYIDKEGNIYLLTVETDEYAESPREAWDNLANIWTWTRNYDIGDEIPNKMNEEEAMIYLCTKYLVKDGAERDAIYEMDSAEKIRFILEAKDKIAAKLISMYDHSGITISTRIHSYPYNDRWDSSIIGLAWIDKDTIMRLGSRPLKDENGNRIRKEYKHDDGSVTYGCETEPITDENWYEYAMEIIDSEVEVLDEYIQGDVYSMCLEKKVVSEDIKTCPHCGEVISRTTIEDWEEVFSSNGFYGDDWDKNGIVDELPNGLEELAF